MKNIDEKIEHIRKQPEHVRMRWVWGLVAFSMTIIAFIWLLSMRVNLSEGSRSGTSVREITNTINDTLEGNPDTPSIDQLIEEGKDTLETTQEAKDLLGEANLQLEGIGEDPGTSLDSILNSALEEDIEEVQPVQQERGQERPTTLNDQKNTLQESPEATTAVATPEKTPEETEQETEIVDQVEPSETQTQEEDEEVTTQ